jgi:hypothetical protein
MKKYPIKREILENLRFNSPYTCEEDERYPSEFYFGGKRIYLSLYVSSFGERWFKEKGVSLAITINDYDKEVFISIYTHMKLYKKIIREEGYLINLIEDKNYIIDEREGETGEIFLI